MAINLGTMVWGIKADTKEFSASMAKVENIQKQIRAKERNDRLEQIEEARKVNKIRLEFEAQREQYLNARRKLSETASKEEIANVEKIRKAYIRLADSYDNATEKLASNIRKNRAQLKGLDEELKLAQKSADKAKGLSGMMRGAAGGMGKMIAGGISIAATKELVDSLDELGKRARDIGITASQLQELQHQAKLAGISTSELDVSMRSFNRNVSLAAMGTGEARDALKSMGINLTHTNGQAKTQSELLKEIATYFAENAGEAENAGRAARIFGERGAEMLRIFEQGEGVVNKVFEAKGIDEAAIAAEKFKNVLEDTKNIAFKTASAVVAGYGKIARGIYGVTHDEASSYVKDRYNLTDKQAKRLGAVSQERVNLEKNDFVKMYMRAQSRGDEKASSNLISRYQVVKDYIDLQKEEARIRIDAIKQSRKERKEAARAAEEENYKNNVLKKINEANDRFFNTTQKTKTLEEQREAVFEKLKSTKIELNSLDKRSVEYADAYVAAVKLKGEYLKINAKIADEDAKNRIKNVKKELSETKSEAAKVKRYREELEKRQKAQSESREEFELQTKIQILQAQGKTREAEALKFAKARNALMEKYGYSLKQAEQVQRTLNELDKAKGGVKAEYSEEAKKQAQKILDRGEGGSIGKKTIEEAQAIVDGKTPEGGFTTSMFKRYEDDPKKIAAKSPKLKGGEFGLKGGQFALKNLNVDAKATKENLDTEAKTIEQKNSESLDSLVQQMTELNDKIKELKNTVDGIAIKKGAA